MRLIILGVFVLSSSICSFSQITKQDRLKVKMDSIIRENNFNGVVLLKQDMTEIYKGAFGFSKMKGQIAMHIDNQFVIGSISKQITAVLVLREYEKGNIRLNDKISRFLPNLEQSWAKKVTIHHLLTHTHGITDLDKPLEFKQGSQFHYSQLGYHLLAQILEVICGKSFRELSTEFFAEFKLLNSAHPDSEANINLVVGYEEIEKGKLVKTTNSLENYASAGSFISNANDLIKWNELLFGADLLDKKTLKLMSTNYATRIHPIFERVQYGYGLLFKKGESQLQIGALGYAPGFVSACYFYPKTNMNLVVLSNTAKDLYDFKKTFTVHIELMKLVKEYEK